MSTIEEAREQAREALELVHTWRQREQAWDTPRALGFEKIGQAIRTLLDATEPPAQAEPAEDEREAMANFIDKRLDGDCGYGVGEHLADALIADGYRKGPRPITDEMVEAAARVMFDAPDGTTGDYTWAEMVGEDPSRADLWRADARAILEAAEEARR